MGNDDFHWGNESLGWMSMQEKVMSLREMWDTSKYPVNNFDVWMLTLGEKEIRIWHQNDKVAFELTETDIYIYIWDKIK